MSVPVSAPSATVVFESMFGNTAEIAVSVARGLQEGGVQVACVDVREADPEVALASDLIVLGAPTHAFTLSRPGTRVGAVREGADESRAAMGLREWIPGLVPSADGPPATTFDTRARKMRRLPLGAAPTSARLLRRRGFRLAEPPQTFLVEETQGPLCAGEADRAVRWGRTLASGLATTGSALDAGSPRDGRSTSEARREGDGA